MISSPSNRRGFTLIEMLVVIVIIGILIAIAVPVMSKLSRSSSLQAGIRQVVNSASLARQYAITHRVNTEFRVTNSWNAVTVFANGVQIDKWDYFPPGIFVDTNAIGNASVTFRPTGGTTAGQDWTLVLREGALYAGTQLKGTNANYATITIGYVLGKISVNRP